MTWVMFLLGCGPVPEDLRAEINELQGEIKDLEARHDELRPQVVQLQQRADELRSEIAHLEADAQVLQAIRDGRAVRYILRCKLSQSHFSLDLAEHIKDAMNEVEFDLVTDRTSYEAARPGTELMSAFRGGSAFMRGSWGSWEITVTGKRIEVAQ